MYQYKRGINPISTARQVEYQISNHQDTCLSMSATLEMKKPYNGMYIKDGKILLANVVEKIEIYDKVYKMTQLTTNVHHISCDEYITEINLCNNQFEYDVGEVSYSKKIGFKKDTDILCISYQIKNKSDGLAHFKVIPMITYRDLFTMKKANVLRFNQRALDRGTIINLSVMNSDNIVLKSKEFEWTKEVQTLSNVRHEYINENLEKEIYIEDLNVPGEFEITLKPEEEKIATIYVSTKEEYIDEFQIDTILRDYIEDNLQVCHHFPEEYVELRELALGMYHAKTKSLNSTLPYIKDYNQAIITMKTEEDLLAGLPYLKDLLDLVKAIEGRYLNFKRLREAELELLKIRRYIHTIAQIPFTDEKIRYQLTLLKLWYIESVHKFLQKEDSSFELHFNFVKELLYSVIKEKELCFDDIEIVALTFNAIKIYQEMLSKKGIEDIIVYEIEQEIHVLLERDFWSEEKRSFKRNRKDSVAEANVQMMYTLSLSYPCIVDEKAIKLLDTLFKELYTPYGLREVSKKSESHLGLIYPKYMAHFVKANLRQNGVTRASQKIAYNLIKELLQDISKYVNGGIKKCYHEKGLAIDSIGYDVLTNAEMVRLYNMIM